jgi:hypothetical protein
LHDRIEKNVSFIQSIKRRLHRDIVADPVLHGMVLNLYLNGERYPQQVDDYFPIAEVTDGPLAEQMRTHVADEQKHVLLYERAIAKLDQPIVQLSTGDIFNEVIRSHTAVSFKMNPHDPADARTLKLAHFLAHVHFLEKRVARSLEFHVDACAHSSSDYSQKAVMAVLKDEGRHVRYTREAVQELLPARIAAEVLDGHARAERRANLDFSARQLRRLTRDARGLFTPARRFAYRTCANILNAVLYVS